MADDAEPKTFTLAEVADHKTAEDCWMIIRGDDGIRRVYDVTKFLDDHPGGPEIMIDLAGQDATDEFEDIGHSNDAREQLKDFAIGQIAGDVKADKKTPAAASAGKSSSSINSDKSTATATPLILISVAVAAVALYLNFH